ncbi:hypothetical protein ES332_A11G005700v1 [Gossypium tomentosum]|uniref:Uncharacterized protein n=1 Tax=Gossypium tomentosum TaxID=34277 RepID=A0A5D2N3V3_GOSTO|nr:hypothetical protein ES332_A11G005700v1 [Gossypium tomentosum]
MGPMRPWHSCERVRVQVCRKCGLIGYYSHKLKTGFCSSCKIRENVSSMKLPYACKLLIQVDFGKHFCYTNDMFESITPHSDLLK